MRFMTESQILQYQYDCDRLKLRPKTIRGDQLENVLRQTIRPFEKDIELSGMSVLFMVRLLDNESFTTDWNVLQCSLFHLVYNAVKHGKKGS